MKRAERQQLGAVIEEVRAWVQAAQEIRHLAAHLPVSTPPDLSAQDPLLDKLHQVAASGDLETATQLAKAVFFGGRKKLQPAHLASERLSAFRDQVAAVAGDEAIHALHGRLAAQMTTEREELAGTLNALRELRNQSATVLLDAAHLPITRSGALTSEETTAMQAVLQHVDDNAHGAALLLSPNPCTEPCEQHHAAARLMRDLLLESKALRTREQLAEAQRRVSALQGAERNEVQRVAQQASKWTARARSIRGARSSAENKIQARVKDMLAAKVEAKLANPVTLIPLETDDIGVVEALDLLASFQLTASDEGDLDRVTELATQVGAHTTAVFDATWNCRRDATCMQAHDATPGMIAAAAAAEATLLRLTPQTSEPSGLEQILDPTLAFHSYLALGITHLELIDQPLTARARTGLSSVLNAAKAEKEASARARKAAEDVQANDVANALKAMDLEALRKAAPQERFRVAPLEAYDLHNVWDVLRFQEKYLLNSLSGLGEASARAITQACLRLLEAVRDETPVRIDIKRKSKKTEALLDALRLWDATRKFVPSKDETALAKACASLLNANKSAAAVISVSQSAEPPDVPGLLAQVLDRAAPSTETSDVWTDFLSRPADYFGMLTELGFVTEDEKKMHGDLPEEIIEAVRAKELKRDYLTASLRTYQSFGARFALVQEKVVIGDEMGLGKTVEALAVFTHLRATGHSHFLVVCPAAVVSNWIRETAKHTKLKASRLHGPLWERDYAAKSWIRNGGVAVTTYDLLPWAQEHLNGVEVTAAVFDEAHYIKNPTAKRSVAAAQVMDALKYVVLMTGTPLENSVQEFRNLIGYIRSDLSESAPEFLASKFRKHVAPAYLRRNQEDVLTELPELVEIDEWMGMSTADERSYREAVREGHFMLMRRAAMLSERSLKVERLLEIVEEAEANGRKVIVFSYFREVLSEVARLLPGEVFGPLTGSVPANERQKLVDRFTQASEGAVLVAQVTAGGVGLNIQSASVVVLCEPQIKPTMEAQAIARAHRMGQTNTVQVHRLLTEDSVDERIREILANKQQLFDEFARDSIIAEQAPDAVDVTDAELARIVVAAERERLFGQAHDR